MLDARAEALEQRALDPVDAHEVEHHEGRDREVGEAERGEAFEARAAPIVRPGRASGARLRGAQRPVCHGSDHTGTPCVAAHATVRPRCTSWTSTETCAT